VEFEIAFIVLKRRPLKYHTPPEGSRKKCLIRGKNSVMVMSGILKAYHPAKLTIFGLRCRPPIPSREAVVDHWIT